MRSINSHKINPANDKLDITVTDPVGAGGANHRYEIDGADVTRNASYPGQPINHNKMIILFQNGPIGECGVNGVTQEALLAIVIDRLRSFQAGAFACRENALALTKLEEALHWLLHRTNERML